jgi:hypothetical protein
MNPQWLLAPAEVFHRLAGQRYGTETRSLRLFRFGLGCCLAVLIQLSVLIRYMRQWNSKHSKPGNPMTTALVAGAQFGSSAELVPHPCRTRSHHYHSRGELLEFCAADVSQRQIAVPAWLETNRVYYHPSLWWFFNKVKRLWLAALKRRSQPARLSWERFIQFVARFFPPIRTIHPLPCHRFDAKTRGRSPVR